MDVREQQEQIRKKAQDALKTAFKMEEMGFDKEIVENQVDIAEKLSKFADSTNSLVNRVQKDSFYTTDDRPVHERFWSGFKIPFFIVFFIVLAWHVYGIYENGGGFTTGTFGVAVVFAAPAGACLGLIRVLKLNSDNKLARGSMMALSVISYPALLFAIIYAFKLIFKF